MNVDPSLAKGRRPKLGAYLSRGGSSKGAGGPVASDKQRIASGTLSTTASR
jgi:hypothetical protein